MHKIPLVVKSLVNHASERTVHMLPESNEGSCNKKKRGFALPRRGMKLGKRMVMFCSPTYCCCSRWIMRIVEGWSSSRR
jgi:hypothetical protein